MTEFVTPPATLNTDTIQVIHAADQLNTRSPKPSERWNFLELMDERSKTLLLELAKNTR